MTFKVTMEYLSKTFPKIFVENLTPEMARNYLHRGLIHWAAIEQEEHGLAWREELVY